MTYREWELDHNSKMNKILSKLVGVSIENTITYFNFDNMKVMEPDFCPLYASNTKCHNIDSLNCFLCACPHFRASDTEPFYITGDVSVMSICSINSKQAGSFISGTTRQCDCSNCHIPHTDRYVSAHIRKNLSQKEDLVNHSFLHYLRTHQLSSFLGRWRVF